MSQQNFGLPVYQFAEVETRILETFHYSGGMFTDTLPTLNARVSLKVISTAPSAAKLKERRKRET